MGKGVRVKTNTSGNNSGNNSGNGGIMGSGIFGMFGSTVHCNANDNSFYCSIVKIVNMIIMFFFFTVIIYLLYLAFNYFNKGKKFSIRRKV
jgi:hypothetical protein